MRKPVVAALVARAADDHAGAHATQRSRARPCRAAIAAFAAALVAGGCALARTPLGAVGQHRRPRAPALAPPICGRTCEAAYDAIASALPRERGELLAHAILATPGFDYLQLDHALGVPTSAQIHARWRRSCLERFPARTRAAAACIRSIDSWTSIPLPAPPSWAAS